MLKLKRTICIALCAAMLAAALASCAVPTEKSGAISANVRMTSSDALDAAAWLTERLGERMTGRVVLGTSADGYDLDLSPLENDGYFIRAFGGEDVLFAKTTDGLDRAVRKYAKMVEAGAVSDATYHEGARIKRIEIAGRDISEYTVYAGGSAKLISGANEFASLIKRACGADLAVSTEEPAAPYIVFRFVHDEALNTCGYRWSVTDDGLILECSDLYTPTSPHFAAIRFLETRLDWFGLTFGYETLPEADLISIEAGESGGESNAFCFACPYGDQYSAQLGDAFDHTYGDHYGGFASTHLCGIPQCCHGLQNNGFAGELSDNPSAPWSTDQPCYLSEEFLESSYDDVSAYIQRQLDAGKVIGEDFFFVDIAAGDNGQWCFCKDCKAMYIAEGGTPSASVVTWANALTEALDEVYPGLAYGIFAYAGTNKPPKTVRANEHLYITYCYDMSCDMHAHDGHDCGGSEPLISVAKKHGNDLMSANLEGWLAMTENVYVWFYGMDQGFATLSYVDMTKDDLRYFHGIGVKGFFWEAEDRGFSTGKVAKWMQSALVWDIDMTDEEYDAYLDRVLAAMYGDGAPYVKEYVGAVEAIQRSGACAHCWYSAAETPTLMPVMFSAAFDTLFALTEAAVASADSRKQEMRAVKLASNCIYQGCVSSYFDAYEAGDDARCAELARRYELIETRLAKFGIDPASPSNIYAAGNYYWSGGVGMTRDVWDGDMEVMAWSMWNNHTYNLHLTRPTRAMPERVAEILAERGE